VTGRWRPPQGGAKVDASPDRRRTPPVYAAPPVIKSEVFALRARPAARCGKCAVAERGGARLFSQTAVFQPRRQPLRHQHPVRPGFPGLATGPDDKTIVVTESETGAILQARLEVAGKTVYSHL
jgi:hypothetical protein